MNASTAGTSHPTVSTQAAACAALATLLQHSIIIIIIIIIMNTTRQLFQGHCARQGRTWRLLQKQFRGPHPAVPVLTQG
jgi:hypothetical protein